LVGKEVWEIGSGPEFSPPVNPIELALNVRMVA